MRYLLFILFAGSLSFATSIGSPENIALINTPSDEITPKPHWIYTPTNQNLSYASNHTGNYDIYIASIYGSDIMAFTDICSTAADFGLSKIGDDGYTGTTTYFWTSNRPGTYGKYDIYKRSFTAPSTWSGVTVAPGYSTASEIDPCVISETSFYFASNRAGGYGGYDIYYFDNGQVTNLGANINSSADDVAPFVSYYDGRAFMLFSSNRAGGMGGFDIYFAMKEGFGYNLVRNLKLPINSSANEIDPSYATYLTENLLVFSSDRAGGEGGYDIYKAVVTDLNGVSVEPRSLGSVKALYK